MPQHGLDLHQANGTRRSRRGLSGFSLVELMVALAIGVFLLLVLTGYFLSQRETARLTRDLSFQQENVRVAYELLARDIREARYTPCGMTTMPPGINSGALYTTLTTPLEVIDATRQLPDAFTIYNYSASPRRADGTTALLVRYARSDTVTDANVTASNTVVITHNPNNTRFEPGNRVIVCNHWGAVSGTVASVSGSTITLNVQQGALNTEFRPARLAVLEERLWFVGRDGAGGCTGADANQCRLFGAVAGQGAQEYVQGVSALMMTELCETGTGITPCSAVPAPSNRLALSIDQLTAATNAHGSGQMTITIQPIIGLRNPM